MGFSGIAGIITLLYFLVIIGVGIYLLILLTKLVKSHQRGADALETIARKFSSIDK